LHAPNPTTRTHTSTIKGLATKIGNHPKAIEQPAGGLLDQRDRQIQHCFWLHNEATTVVLDVD